MPAAVFVSRIQGINAHLARYRSLSDYGPAIRGYLLVLYLVCSLTVIGFVSRLSALQIWGFMFSGLIVMGGLMLATYFIKAHATFVKNEMQRFTDLDQNTLGLVWLSDRQDHDRLYTFYFSRKEAQVPWRIIVQHHQRHHHLAFNADGTAVVRAESAEFLPAYQSSGAIEVMTGNLTDDVTAFSRLDIRNSGGDGDGDSYISVFELGRVPSYKLELLDPVAMFIEEGGQEVAPLDTTPRTAPS
ncbi:hypothetical protein HK100_005960 [Physocladia obscura]|uniref:Uncharacterized protein n=1 Tax=Physocladia obscura TaxID=109957 RepID=A0AAD5T5I8_9FUNG|nr:hypothetical protein HK100_005960 [Physocladia obscura]